MSRSILAILSVAHLFLKRLWSVEKRFHMRTKVNLMIVDTCFVTEQYSCELSRIVRTAYLDDLNKAC